MTDHPVSLAQQVTFLATTAKIVTVTTSTSGVLTVVLRNLPTERQSTKAARGIAEVPPKQPFRIIVSNFSSHIACMPKLMVITYTGKPPTSVHNSCGRIQETFPGETFEKQGKPKSQNHMHYAVSAVHYKPNVNPATQTAQQTDVLQKDDQPLARDRLEVVDLSDNHGQYRRCFINILS